jgi:2-phospho-L-lactate guanylyltransferase
VRAAVLVPVKGFRHAKVRLASALDADERSALARRMADGVVAAARPLPVFVVCDDDEVAAWARSLGAEVLWRPGRGLNRAVDDGVVALRRTRRRTRGRAHADLPMATDLAGQPGTTG